MVWPVDMADTVVDANSMIVNISVDGRVQKIPLQLL